MWARLKSVVLCVVAMFGPTSLAMGREAMPANVRILMTSEGPVYATSEGMTLYKSATDKVPGKSECTSAPETEAVQANTNFSYPTPNPRRACITQTPPFRAASNSRSVGRWSIVNREDGIRQWAYAGAPLYTSIADRAPGDTNGSMPIYAPKNMGLTRGMIVATAPLGSPSGIGFAQSPAGIGLVNAKGEKLYTYDRDTSSNSSRCNGACAQQWSPVLAANLSADANDDWSSRPRTDGSRQWAYKKKLLYTSRHLSGQEVERDGIPGWHEVLLWVAPNPPPQVKVGWTLVGQTYADSRGRSLYIFLCREETRSRLSCDRQGDPDTYYLALCGGIDNCRQSWHPLLAPPGARPIGNLWSIMSIDPDNPIKPLEGQAVGVRVWAYKGRPLFTYAKDHRPGETKGDGIREWRVSAWTAAIQYGSKRLGQEYWTFGDD